MKTYEEPKTQNRLFAFNRVKNLSFLPVRERAVLSFYADQYNWERNEGSHWSQRKICDLLGIKAEKTLRESNKVLDELKWVSFDRKFSSTTADYQSVYAQIHIGNDDPKTLEVHRENLLKQLDKDTFAPELQRQRDIEFIKLHSRHETEFLDLSAAKENFKQQHPNIYSRDFFLGIQEKDSENDSEITY